MEITDKEDHMDPFLNPALAPMEPHQLELPLIIRGPKKRGAKPGQRKILRQEGEPATKLCKKCEQELAIEEFGKRTYKGKTKMYRRAWCFACEAGETQERWWRDPEKAREMARTVNERRASRDPDGAKWGAHNVPRATVLAMIEEQGGKCPICETKVVSYIDGAGREHSGWHLDHNHDCCPGKWSQCGTCFRRPTCGTCNQGLGQFKDNPELLRKAATYLEGFRDAQG